jgi:HTH-type transcriptional regulator/antitoxin HigA
MEIKLIKTESEYKAMLARMEALLDPEPGSAGEDELELLALLVEKYEREHHPIDLPDPIEAIQLRMELRGLNRKDMIQYLGSQSKVSEVLNYKRPLSLSMIRNLYEGLGIPAEVLLQVQPRHVIKASLCEPEKAAQAEVYTNCAQLTEELNQDALQEWLSRARQLAMAQELPAFERASVNEGLFRDLNQLSCDPAGPQMACELLNNKGIHLVAQKAAFKTILDGACFYSLQGCPLIALTLRNDRLDCFWFILIHQLAHLYLHQDERRTAFFDSLEGIFDPTAPPEEEQTNQLLRELLIPADTWENGVRIGLESNNRLILDYLIRSNKVSPEIISIRARLEGAQDVYAQLFPLKRVNEKLEVFV